MKLFFRKPCPQRLLLCRFAPDRLQKRAAVPVAAQQRARAPHAVQKPVAERRGFGMALLALLLIGFNDLNTVLMNPQNGQVYKYGMNDSDKLFSENGNHFITYITEG